MSSSRVNWAIVGGFLLAVLGFISYLVVFVRFASTRDFPWVNLILLFVAGVLLVIGMRRSFARGTRKGKVGSAITGVLGFLVIGLFLFTFFIGARQIPASRGAPQVGQKAPDFTLPDTSGKPVSLSELLSSPIGGNPSKGVLLIFYRGYW